MITKTYNVSQQNATSANEFWEMKRKAHSALACLLVGLGTLGVSYLAFLAI
jgi:hypothetical protein